MNNEECLEWLQWLLDNVKGSELRTCDESKHMYVNDKYVGGYAGDDNTFFIVGTHCASEEDVEFANKLVSSWTHWKNYS